MNDVIVANFDCDLVIIR